MAAARRQNIQALLRGTYPNIYLGWSNRTAFGTPLWVKTPLSQRPLGGLLRVQTRTGIGMRVPEAEVALGRLLQRFTFNQLLDQYRLLLSPHDDDFDAGIGETLGLSVLEQHGVLNTIGFPVGRPMPPFDCSVRLPSGAIVGLDFKSASNSGLDDLRGLLRAGADAWRQVLGRRRCDIEINWAGTLNQEAVRLAAPVLQAEWTNFLQQSQPTLPTRWFVQEVNELEVRARALSRNAVGTHTGVGGVRPASLHASRTISRHATHKARNGIPFLLAYVACPGRPGGDLRRGILDPAAITAHRRESNLLGQAHQHWLGLLSIDLTGANAAVDLLARYAAGWPAGRADADAWIQRFGRLHTRYRAR